MSHGASAPHEELRCARTRGYYREALGLDAEVRRALEIAALPVAEWKGRTLRTIRCCGTSGKGPHDCNVPESMLWALIGLKPFYCVYHRDDAVVGYHADHLLSEASGSAQSAAQNANFQTDDVAAPKDT